MLPVMRSKMGRAASAGGKSLFLQCFVGSRRQKYAASSWSDMLQMRLLGRAVPDSDLWARNFLSGLYQGRSPPSRADMPRTSGRMGFSGCWSEDFDGKAQNQGPGKMAKYICVGAPLLIFMFFGGAPGFCKKQVFENRQIFVWKRSAKLSRFKDPFWRFRVWNKPC